MQCYHNRGFTIVLLILCLYLFSCALDKDETPDKQREATVDDSVKFSYSVPNGWVNFKPEVKHQKLFLAKVDSLTNFTSNVQLIVTPRDEYKQFGINSFSDHVKRLSRANERIDNIYETQNYIIEDIHGSQYYMFTYHRRDNNVEMEQRLYTTEVRGCFASIIFTKQKYDQEIEKDFGVIIDSIILE